MTNPPAVQHINGRACWVHQDGDKYLVTGRDRSGKRFAQRHSTWMMASCINLYDGAKYLIRNSRRHLITRVHP